MSVIFYVCFYLIFMSILLFYSFPKMLNEKDRVIKTLSKELESLQAEIKVLRKGQT